MTAAKMNNICLEFNAFSTFKGFHEFNTSGSSAEMFKKCFFEKTNEKKIKKKKNKRITGIRWPYCATLACAVQK